MEQKSFLFNARRLEVNNYITIIECGEKRCVFVEIIGLMEKYSMELGIGFNDSHVFQNYTYSCL